MPSPECPRQPHEASPLSPPPSPPAASVQAASGLGKLDHLFRHSAANQQINPLQRIVMRYLQEKQSKPPSQGSGHAD